MNVLLLGSGGREHAFARSISASPLCEKLYIGPGNGGTSQCGQNLSLNPLDFIAVEDAVKTYQIDLVIVGPEQPLVEGIVDFLDSKNISVIGPDKNAAQLEGSKEFSKKFMAKYGIPTAAYASFHTGQEKDALEFISRQELPIVVKASGLAAGKGVVICEEYNTAYQCTTEMLSGASFGSAGQTVVIESFLSGIEVSVFALSDGETYLLLPDAKDYKRIGEADTGLNTGGMGAVSPSTLLSPEMWEKIEKKIIQPTFEGLKTEGMKYKGFLFFGLMLCEEEPFVIEYNCRMGDPETEVVLPRITSDLLDLLNAVSEGNLNEKKIAIRPEFCTTIMLVSGGYPQKYEKGKTITLVPTEKDSIVFHAGTQKSGNFLVTSGGRVLAISSFGTTLKGALNKSLDIAEKLSFEGKYFRRDIGQDILNLLG